MQGTKLRFFATTRTRTAPPRPRAPSHACPPLDWSPPVVPRAIFGARGVRIFVVNPFPFPLPLTPRTARPLRQSRVHACGRRPPPPPPSSAPLQVLPCPRLKMRSLVVAALSVAAAARSLTADWKVTGRASATALKTFSVAMPMRDFDGLDRKLQEIADPFHPSYGQVSGGRGGRAGGVVSRLQQHVRHIRLLVVPMAGSAARGFVHPRLSPLAASSTHGLVPRSRCAPTPLAPHELIGCVPHSMAAARRARPHSLVPDPKPTQPRRG
jgi:hypothetical protein